MIKPQKQDDHLHNRIDNLIGMKRWNRGVFGPQKNDS